MAVDSTQLFAVTDEGADVSHAVAGFEASKLAGLTAADYLRERLDAIPSGDRPEDRMFN